MRIIVATFIFMMSMLCHADDLTFSTPIVGSPDISIFVIGNPTEDFAINESGIFEWDTWKGGKPSKHNKSFKYNRDEYEKVLHLVKEVFSKNYQSKSSINQNKPYVVYQVKLGEYWNSLQLNLSYQEGAATPVELQELMVFIRGLRQPNNSLKADTVPVRLNSNVKYRSTWT
jgi:hypothetical protein